MRNRGRRQRPSFIALVGLVVALALPAVASAADPGTATIIACKGDSLTVAGRVALSGSAARRVRGAVLQMRFQAYDLFGLPHSAAWKPVGKKRRASGQQSFSGLPAGNWVGVLSWRYKKGRRTVLSDIARSQPLRMGGKRGIANCTLDEGAKPVDTKPPTVQIGKTDGNWYRGPAQVPVLATDDFSGVARVVYSLDGGPATPVPNGSAVTIPNGGQHTLSVSATDVAGNTGTASGVVKVDASPPTKPVITAPASVTANGRPTISWAPSSDADSGVRGYYVAVRAADGSMPVQQVVDANTTSIQSPTTLADNQDYTVTVTAADGTSDGPWTSTSDAYAFRVDSTPNVTAVAPPAGTILAGIGNTQSFTITLDRPADPGSVASPGVVTLHRNTESGTDVNPAVGCANSPCTTITVSAAMNEGRYTLAVNGLKSGDGEGTTFQSFSAAYAMPFLENASVSAGGGVCVTDQSAPTATKPVNVTSGPENGQLDFDWSYPTGSNPGWTVSMSGGTLGSASGIGGGGSDHATVPFTVASGSHSVSFTFTSKCSGGSQKLTVTNIRATRLP